MASALPLAGLDLAISADTETCRIQPGLKAPPLVCVSYYDRRAADPGPHLLHWSAARPYVEHWIRYGVQCYYNAAFDLAVYCANWPDLIPDVFRAYEEGRVYCSMIAQKIWDIACGTDRKYMQIKGGYALDKVLTRHSTDTAGLPGAVAKLSEYFPIDKDSEWRLRFDELRALPIAQWPDAAVSYALWDAPPPIYILRSIAAKANAKGMPDALTDLPAQCALSFCLQLISCYGVRTDLQRVAAFAAGVHDRLDKAKSILLDHGLIRPNMTGGFSRNIQAAREYVERVCAAKGLPVELTPKGNALDKGELPKHRTSYVALDKGALAGYADPALDAYSDFSQATALVAKVEDLRMGAYYPLQPDYTSPLATGRTSCRKPGVGCYGAQLQNPPARIAGFRETITARPGHAFISIDYGRMELVCLAQVLYWLFGNNALMDMLNADIDPLAQFGGVLAGLSYEEMIKRAGEKAIKNWRNMAKPCWYGFPGGMGPPTFVKWSYAQYGIEFSVDRVREEIKPAWLATIPEMRKYYKYISREVEQGYSRLIMPWGPGRYRGHQSYTAACNEKYQALGAAAVNASFFACMRLCYACPGNVLYGARIWNIVHDELLFEVPLDRVDAAAREATRIMIGEFRRFTPDVKITAEPVAMLHWSKNAKPTFANGMLVPWVPSPHVEDDSSCGE